eukprot:m.180748 g.180748  ORF g.180748 m.180748 type:complete len:90 (+) comp24567_c0_seq13:430-699(+)
MSITPSGWTTASSAPTSIASWGVQKQKAKKRGECEQVCRTLCTHAFSRVCCVHQARESACLQAGWECARESDEATRPLQGRQSSQPQTG